MSVSTKAASGTRAIRPFAVPHVPDTELELLRARITVVRWPDKEPVLDQSQGVQLATMQALTRYWTSEHDWRRCEARLQALPNFVTEIDGVDVHFIHVRSRHEDALPLIVTHGWPGSIIEQLKIIEPLTDPTASGGSASDAFHLVIPSMPGYGFSARPTTTGWDPAHIASAWAELMARLGYTKYVASGGDWGAIITDLLAVQAPAGLAGMHTNMAGAIPPDVDRAAMRGDPPPPGLSSEERSAYETVREFYAHHLGYSTEMRQRPQTLYGLADSPVALAAWILDHDPASYAHIAELFAGRTFGAITRDDILDNITLYWLTNTGVSSGRLYWENKGGFFDAKGVRIPAAVSVFPEELYQPPRSWAEKAYPNLIHYNRLDRGGHFAAWEQPELLTSELRESFRSLR